LNLQTFYKPGRQLKTQEGST